MLTRGLVESARLHELFEAIEPSLYRYPAVDPAAFRRAFQYLIDQSLRRSRPSRRLYAILNTPAATLPAACPKLPA